MITAKEIMTAETPSLSFDTSVLDAIYFLSTHKDNFVAVRADAERYHGVLTEAAMMQIFLRYQRNPETEALIFYRQYFEPMQLIQEGEIFPDIVKKLATAIGNRCFVINSRSQVIGHISAKDILPYFTKEYGLQAEKKAKVAPPMTEQFRTQLEDTRSDLYLYESFFTNSPFMMHSVDSKGEIRMANQMLHQVLGYQYGELIGKTIFDIYPPENHAVAAEGIKKILSRGYNNVSNGQMVTKDKKLVEVELISKALQDQTHQSIGTITVSRPLKMSVLLEMMGK